MNPIHMYARALCERAFDIAVSMDLNVSIVATDLAGHPMVVLRGEHTSYASLEAARRKAVAAGGMQMSTDAMVEMFAPDPLVLTAAQASGDMLVVPGGFPIIFGSGCVGGLGIAGAHYKQDHMIGEKAFAAVNEAAKNKKD
jgi:glc operon protein GlcG